MSGIKKSLLLMAFLIVSNNSYALPDCPSDVNARWHNCFGTFTYANGDKYVGEFRDNKKHGQGTHTFADGDKYVGEFKDGSFTGQGTYTFDTGETYVGEFRDHKMHGQGAYTYANGDKYVGEVKDGSFTGQGTYTFANGETYVGEFRDGYYVSQDEQRKADQVAIEEASREKENRVQLEPKEVQRRAYALPDCQGDWQSWNDCIGAATFPNGSKYVGEWIDGMMHGQGAYHYPADSQFKGDKYVGEFVEGTIHGQGVYKTAGGAKYVGEFRNGRKNGQGAFTFAKEIYKYVGEFQDDKKHGAGAVVFANGDRYVGEFRNDMKHGQGVYRDANRDKYVGDFRDDKKDGQGVYTYANGDKYVGEFRDDKRHGGGVIFYSRDHGYPFHSSMGEFREDTPLWPLTFFYPDGREEMGRLDGKTFIRDCAAEELFRPQEPQQCRPEEQRSDEEHIEAENQRRADERFLVFWVVSCTPHRGGASMELGVKNRNERTIDSVWIDYNVYDEYNKIFTSDDWTFEGIRQGKTVVDIVIPIDSLSCDEISAIEVVSAECRFAGEKRDFDCFDAIRPRSGALRVRE